MGAAHGGIAVGQLPSLFVAAATGVNCHLFLAGLMFAGVVDGGWSVVQVVVFVEDHGEQGDGAVGVCCDLVAVAGECVVAEQCVEVAVGPTVGRWFGEYVRPGGGGVLARPVR